MTTEGTAGIRKSNRRWQSDVIVDLIKHYDFPYIALNFLKCNPAGFVDEGSVP